MVRGGRSLPLVSGARALPCKAPCAALHAFVSMGITDFKCPFDCPAFFTLVR